MTTRCSCGREKAQFKTRKHARRHARKFPGSGHLSAFHCSAGWWHLGHLPEFVVAGLGNRTLLDRPQREWPLTVSEQGLQWLRAQRR